MNIPTTKISTNSWQYECRKIRTPVKDEERLNLGHDNDRQHKKPEAVKTNKLMFHWIMM
jgi:hypothetical protein